MGLWCNRYTTILFVWCVSTSISYKLLKIQKRKNIKNRSTATSVSSKPVPKTAPDLPLEIILEILPYLNVKDLLRYKTVCKQWKTLIHEALTQDPYFSHKFTSCKSRTFTCTSIPENRKQRYEENVYILGTCNGLDFTMERMPSTIGIFIFYVLDSWTFNIRNTETRQVSRIPCQAYYRTKSCHYAFAFIPNTNEYKLANIYLVTETKRVCAVLTIGGSSGGDELKWRYISFPSSKRKIDYDWVVQAGAVVHCMHYIMLQPEGFACEIMSIDLESEEITETNVCLELFLDSPIPVEYPISWNGCLAFASNAIPKRLDIRVLKDYKKNIWGKRFFFLLEELEADDFYLLFAQDVVLWLRSTKAEKVIGWNIKRNRLVKTFVVPKKISEEQTMSVFYKVPTLVSLKGMEAADP